MKHLAGTQICVFICRCSGIIVVIAGGLALMAACSTILFGGLLGATRLLENGAGIVYRGWVGMGLSLLTMAFAFAAFYRPSRMIYAGAALAAVAGALAGGHLVALFLAPAAIVALVTAICSVAADPPRLTD